MVFWFRDFIRVARFRLDVVEAVGSFVLSGSSGHLVFRGGLPSVLLQHGGIRLKLFMRRVGRISVMALVAFDPALWDEASLTMDRAVARLTSQGYHDQGGVPPYFLGLLRLSLLPGGAAPPSSPTRTHGRLSRCS